MAKLGWIGWGAAVLACGWLGCSGNVQEGTGGGGAGGGGTGGGGGSGGTTSCNPNCAAPPQGCHFNGEATCDPPSCPPIVCDDAGVADASEDATCLIDCAPPPDGCHYEGEVTCNPPQCPPLVCVDAANDAPDKDVVPMDAPGENAADSSLPDMSDFAGMLDGVWLIGWSGGMNHYSWVRITGGPQWGGDAEFLSGADLFANVPFWDCSGAGTWMITAKPYTIGLYFPSGCTNGFAAYTFLTLQPASGYPPGALLAGTLEDPTMTGLTLEGYKFPPDQCDAAMTTCQDPWQ